MPATETIRQMLAPGRPFDPGRVWEVVELIEGQPRKLAHLIKCHFDENPAIASPLPTRSSVSPATAPTRHSVGKNPSSASSPKPPKRKSAGTSPSQYPASSSLSSSAAASPSSSTPGPPTGAPSSKPLPSTRWPISLARTLTHSPPSSTSSALPAAPELPPCAPAVASSSRHSNARSRSTRTGVRFTCSTDTLAGDTPAKKDSILGAWFSFFHPSCPPTSPASQTK